MSRHARTFKPPKATRALGSGRNGGAAFLALLLLFLGASPLNAQAQLKVFVSIPPQADLAERIAGPLAEVNVLVGPGQNHHTFEPTPKQMADLARANVYFSIGLPFERRLLEKIRAANPALKCIDSSAGIALRQMEQEDQHPGDSHNHGATDPHTWLNPLNAKIIAANISRGMQTADPAHAADYDRGLAALLRELDECHARISALLSPFKGGSFYVYHPAFGYFADAYGLRQIAVEIEGKEPTAKQLGDLITQAKKEGVRVIFVQQQFPRRAAETVAKEVGGAVVALDPLAPDYVHNLESIAEQLAAAFR